MKPNLEEIDEVEKVYKEFWAEIVAPTGVLDIVEVKKELFDYYNFLEETAKVYDHVTGNRISKPNTMAVAVISEADARVDELVAEALQENNKNIEVVLAEIERAYSEDFFSETTEGEREDVKERYPGFIDRTSASQGRHLAKVIRRRLIELEAEDE